MPPNTPNSQTLLQAISNAHVFLCLLEILFWGFISRYLIQWLDTWCYLSWFNRDVNKIRVEFSHFLLNASQLGFIWEGLPGIHAKLCSISDWDTEPSGFFQLNIWLRVHSPQEVITSRCKTMHRFAGHTCNVKKKKKKRFKEKQIQSFYNSC